MANGKIRLDVAAIKHLLSTKNFKLVTKNVNIHFANFGFGMDKVVLAPTFDFLDLIYKDESFKQEGDKK